MVVAAEPTDGMAGVKDVIKQGHITDLLIRPACTFANKLHAFGVACIGRIMSDCDRVSQNFVKRRDKGY